MRESPFRYVNVLCFSRLPLPRPVAPDSWLGAMASPIRAYPFDAVRDKGKRLELKSNALPTEKALLCRGRALFDGSRGSSFSRESLRDDGTPLDDDSLLCRALCEGEEAREASSRESRETVL